MARIAIGLFLSFFSVILSEVNSRACESSPRDRRSQTGEASRVCETAAGSRVCETGEVKPSTVAYCHRHLRLRSILTTLLFFLATLISTIRAHVPVPDSVLNPQTAPEIWNVLRLATANVERLLKENRLAEINDQLSLCSPALRALPKFAAPDQQPQVAAQAIRCTLSMNASAQAIASGDRATAASTFSDFRAALDKLAVAFDPKVTRADIYFCPMHPDVLSPDPSTLCTKCGMSLVPRRIPYSFIYVPPGEPSLLLTASTDTPLAVGQPSHVKIHLCKRDGSPVVLSDLTVTHTRPIHLLIVDSTLEDYHHEHPTPTDVPGEYTFSFTPAKSTPYRIFADVVPAATGIQEYPFTDLPGSVPAQPPIHREDSFTSTANGLTFHLSLDQSNFQPLRAGQSQNLQITIQDSTGQPFHQLEPVMAAFAHLVGFYDDGQTVVHLHPAGSEITNPALRGGPTLDFKFYPPKSGFIRLYVQVQVNGQQIFAPFNLNIVP